MGCDHAASSPLNSFKVLFHSAHRLKFLFRIDKENVLAVECNYLYPVAGIDEIRHRGWGFILIHDFDSEHTIQVFHNTALLSQLSFVF